MSSEEFLGWKDVYDVKFYGARQKEYKCGYCEKFVAGRKGIAGEKGVVLICPNCAKPTFIGSDEQYPGPPYGEHVDQVPEDVDRLFREAKECVKHSLYNASVLTARKVLMHVAVDKGAGENLSFARYVQYLSAEHYLPPDGEKWVDQIRQKGNEANHELPSMTQEDAEELIKFLEMLLRFVYELPGAIPKETEK